MLRKVFKIKISIASLAILAGLTGCKDKQSPGYEYMPDMYRTPAIDTYNETVLTETGLSALTPPSGTISRGNMAYPYPNTNEGYEAAGLNLKNPIPFSEAELEKGKVLYGKFCVHCHGKTGQGDGSVPTNSDYPPPPSYSAQLKDLPEGKIFHSMHYGRNLMGSHASQISQDDRWRLVYFVQSLQDKERFDATYRTTNNETPIVSEDTNQ